MFGTAMEKTMEDIKEKLYRETFDAIIAQVTYRRRTDRTFDAHEIKKLLETAYVNLGNDWVGRGSLYDTVQEATIAAYESVLAELQK